MSGFIFKRLLSKLLVFFIFFLGACSTNIPQPPALMPAADAALPVPTLADSAPTLENTALPAPTEPKKSQLGPCEGNDEYNQPNYVIVEAGTKAEHVWKSQFVPWWVRSSPDGRVLAVTNGGDSIYELKPDGTLETAFRCPGVMIETFTAASDGALWFATRDGGRLYRVDKEKKVKIIAQNGNRNLEAGLDGSVFAMENGIVQIFPDGMSKPIAQKVYGRKFAIGPLGEVVALVDGKIVQVMDEGIVKTIASGYGPEPWLAFDQDGFLFVTHWNGVDRIDLTNGTINTITWLQGINIAESGTFAPDGRLLMYHPNTNVYAIDFEQKNWKTYYQVTSNSWAMAANSDDGVYIAFGNNGSAGETAIFKVINQNTLELITKVPYGIERSMAFDSSGMGYLAVGDITKGGAIYRFDPESSQVELYHLPKCFPGSLTVHPLTDQLWWSDCNNTLESLDVNGVLQTIPGIPGAEGYSLAITPEGEFYTIVFFHRDDPNTPYKHGIYHFNEGISTWEVVADLTQMDPGITLSTITACPDGSIYTIESLDSTNLPVNHSSYNAVRRLEPDGRLTLLGFDFGFDGLAASCDRSTGQIFFTSAEGIFAVTPP
ncbi:MAG TPA: hypothetical protein VN226_03745 [Anaerolineales bacterium]|nr:hypothetical protein [Anaerolineales bacterium]